MNDEPLDDPELEDCMRAAVDRGAFATVEEARDDFWSRLDQSIAQADAGQLIDAEIVFEELRQRYASWPDAAE